MNPAQIKASDIRVEAATVVSAASAASIPLVRLAGVAVLPPQAIETVSAPVAGFVQAVLVSPTDTLRAGQAVANLHSAQLMEWQRDYIQLDVQAKQAHDRLQRSERLAAEGIVAESRVREDRYAHTQATIAAQERKQALQLSGMSDARVKALADKPAVQAQLSVNTGRAGTVMEVLASAGQRVEAGAPLITLARSGLLALELQATAAQSLQLQTGAMVKVAGCAQPGRVRGMAALMRGGNQAVTVHVDMPNAGHCLRANQTVEAEITLNAPTVPAVSIPTSALFQHAAQDHVFVQDAQGFHATPVRVLARQADRSQLATSGSTGLKPGSNVATQGLATLKGAWLGLGEDMAAPAATSATTLTGKP